jgi:hypothetical protein
MVFVKLEIFLSSKWTGVSLKGYRQNGHETGPYDLALQSTVVCHQGRPIKVTEVIHLLQMIEEELKLSLCEDTT